MITIKNIQTGEISGVKNTGFYEGKLFVFGKGMPTKWANKNPMFSLTGEILASGAYNKYEIVFVDGQGFELVKSEKAERKSRAKKAATKKAEDVTIKTTDEPKAEPVEVVAEPTKVVEAEDITDTTNEQALIAAIKNLRGCAVDMAKVREIVNEEFARLAAEDTKKAAKVLKAIAKVKGDANEVHCAKYDRILAKVSRGRRVYLHGPAGRVKSPAAL